ncbi:hypothetical protein Ancab_002182 [Ancistrocladus abbreviatus]
MLRLGMLFCIGNILIFEEGSKIITELGQFAVYTFNKNFHSLDGVSGPLEFEAVLAAEKQVVNGIKYRLKINAKDKEGDTKTFDADVIVKPKEQVIASCRISNVHHFLVALRIPQANRQNNPINQIESHSKSE